MFRNLIRLALAGATAAAILVVPALPGSAQPSIFPRDSCIGIDHFPDNPIGNAPSAVEFLFTVDPTFAGNDLMITFDGASGVVESFGTIDSAGLGNVRAPLFSYGPHQITDLYINPGGVMGDIDFSGIGDNGAFVVDDAENVCDPGSLSFVKSATTTTTVPPTTTTTMAATTTTTVAETTATTETPETTATTESTPPTSIQIIDSGSGTSYTAWWWIGGILLVVGGGVFFFAREGDTCIPLKARWVQAQKACDEAKAELEARKKSLNEALAGLKDASKEKNEWEEGVKELEDELDSLRRSRGTSVGTGGTTFHRIREGLVTSEGLESIIEAVENQLESRRENVGSWDESINQWKDHVKTHEKLVAEAQARVNELCAAAEAARKAYEDCIKAQSAPTPDPAPAPTGGGEPGTEGGGSGGGGGTVPPPPVPPTGPSGPTGPTDGGDPPDATPSNCTEGDTEEEELLRRTFTVGRNAGSLTLSIDPPTDEFEEWMTETLSQTGRISPTNLADPGFPKKIKDLLPGLDTSLSVAHRVEIRIPRQRVTYACIQHRRCQGGNWVDTYKETRHMGSEQISDLVITSDKLGPKISSSDVSRLLTQAAAQYARMAKADEEIDKLCP